MSINIFRADWPSHQQHIAQIRRSVFVEEQHVDPELEWDGLDQLNSTSHFLASLDGNFIGTVRIQENGKIGRMCVLKPYRGQGIGSNMLEALLRYLAEHTHHSELYLNAQVSASAFYQKYGFTETGPTFVEADIKHRRMSLDLNSAAALNDIFSDKIIRLQTAADFTRHLLRAIASGRRNLHISTLNLPSHIYTEAVAQALSKLARAYRESKVSILVSDTGLLSERHNAIVQLSQRLPSSIEIRKVNKEIEPNGEAYAIVDQRRMIYFNEEASPIGFASYNAAAEAHHQLEPFQRLWQHHSTVDPNLQRLSL
ncbi:MAG: putative GNAT family N-acyltransferase [Lentisphaeria bacterium]